MGTTRFGLAACMVALAVSTGARADERQEACKKAMNDRIQVCTDECTHRALTAASNYVDKNNNVKFGCLKGCAVGQILQMQACREGKGTLHTNPVETNPQAESR